MSTDLDLPAWTLEQACWLKQWPDGLIALSQDFKIEWLSEKARECLGYDDQVIGLSIHDVLCTSMREDLHEPSACPLCQANSSSELVYSGWWNSQYGTHISVDYRLMDFSFENHVRRVISFFDNQTRQHSYREMQKLTQYVDHSPAPIAEFDSDAQMLFGNPAMQQILLKFGFDDLGNARILPDQLAVLCAQVAERQQGTNDLEVNVDGHWFRWHLHPVVTDEANCVIAFLFDITDQRLAEQTLMEAQRAARRDFYAKMVHELRTPLNTIVGFSQLLLKRLTTSLNERDLSSLKAIRMAGLQLNELVSDTLDAAKLDAGKMTLQIESFPVSRVIDSLQDQISYLAEGKQLLYCVQYETTFGMRTDYKKLRQILLNLLSNSIKYTHQGQVSLVVKNLDEHWASFEVIDTGMGIPEEQQAHLFNAYQQVESHKSKDIQGTGLGLTLVAEMVKLLGGEVKFTSQLGQGSHFSVRLPKD
jgi:two-component system, autoinducer 2 sensor kinase/phosphatase LuxQ